jgi:peptidoglycan/LPS O-acetylase OafA/YrhL
MSNEQSVNQGASTDVPEKNPGGGDAALGTAGNIEAIAAPGRKHYPALDGLRGLAILLVLFCHYAFILPVRGRVGASLEMLSFQGWVGVTLFFVLSGFLITGILVDSKGQPQYFKNFYARRFLRIFPLYYGVLAVELAILLVIKFGFAHAWLHLHNPQKLWAAMPWFWTYTTNIGQAFFHIHTVLQGHFWSLAVEEQFYFVWPLLVCFMPWRALVHSCLVLVALAFAVRFLLAGFGMGFAAYSFTPCQFDALGLGALIALAVRNSLSRVWLGKYSLRICTVAGLTAAAAIVIAVSFQINPTLLGSHSMRLAIRATHAPWLRFRSYPWFSAALYAPLDIAFAALLAAIVTGASAGLQRIFGWKPLRALGGYSYGLYVFHFIVFMVLGNLLIHFPRIRDATNNNMLSAIGLLLANLVISFALAVTSFHLYEKRFLKLKKYFPERATSMIKQDSASGIKHLASGISEQ